MPRLRVTRNSATGAAAGGVAGPSYDAAATTYFAAVEAADGQSLESGVKTAINDFIVGCKADGVWSAIKASCILAGARTLAGALVPLVGAAPTNYNFVSGDYNRKTGVIGNGTNKWIDTKKNFNDIPPASGHFSVNVTLDFTGNDRSYIGTFDRGGLSRDGSGLNHAVHFAKQVSMNNSTTFQGMASVALSGTSYTRRINQATVSATISPSTPNTWRIGVLAMPLDTTGTSTAFYGPYRISFYSLGEALDLALLDTRVTALMSALATAIP
jgi:hypothetical protein